MIKFFRKIRHGLLSENKFSKYLIYAFGEIMLVVIGILMALQINNWNQDQISKKEFNQTMQALAQDIKSDITILDSYLSRLKAQEEGAQFIIPILENRTTTFDSVAFYNAFLEMSNLVIMDLNSEVWDEIRKSGSAKAFADPELVSKIQNYYHTYKRSASNWENEKEPRIEIRGLKYELLDQTDLEKLRAVKDSMIPSPRAFEAIMKDKRVVNITKRIEYTSTLFIKSFTEIKELASEIYDLINKQYGTISKN